MHLLDLSHQLEYFSNNTSVFINKTQQYLLCSNKIMAKAPCIFLWKQNGFNCLLCKPLKNSFWDNSTGFSLSYTSWSGNGSPGQNLPYYPMHWHLEILKKFVTLSGTVVKVDIIFWFFQILDLKYFFEWQPNMQSRWLNQSARHDWFQVICAW